MILSLWKYIYFVFIFKGYFCKWEILGDLILILSTLGQCCFIVFLFLLFLAVSQLSFVSLFLHAGNVSVFLLWLLFKIWSLFNFFSQNFGCDVPRWGPPCIYHTWNSLTFFNLSINNFLQMWKFSAVISLNIFFCSILSLPCGNFWLYTC